MALVAVAVGAYLLGRARAPEILRSPTATTGVLWACNGRLVGAVALDAGPVRITTADGTVLTASVDDDGSLAVAARAPGPATRVRVSRGATEFEVPVLPCASRS